jgi:hypothetical protein
VSIVGSRESDGWETNVLGPNGLAGHTQSYTLAGNGGEHQPPVIANVLVRLLPARPNMQESDLRLNVLVKGPIPHGSAPNPLAVFW